MKKFKVLFAVAVILIVCFFIVSIVAYQRIINRGSVIADNQCLTVNPLIIERKNSFLASMKILQSNANTEAYLKETENYFAISQRYVVAQQAWLKDQKAHMDRWDFQTFVPSYIRDAAKAQYDSREATAMSAWALNEAFKSNEYPALQKTLTKTVFDQTAKAKKAEDEYNRLWNAPREFNLLTRLTKVPESKCPPENFNIPDVPDLLNPETIPTNYGQPLS